MSPKPKGAVSAPRRAKGQRDLLEIVHLPRSQVAPSSVIDWADAGNEEAVHLASPTAAQRLSNILTDSRMIKAWAAFESAEVASGSKENALMAIAIAVVTSAIAAEHWTPNISNKKISIALYEISIESRRLAARLRALKLTAFQDRDITVLAREAIGVGGQAVDSDQETALSSFKEQLSPPLARVDGADLTVLLEILSRRAASRANQGVSISGPRKRKEATLVRTKLLEALTETTARLFSAELTAAIAITANAALGISPIASKGLISERQVSTVGKLVKGQLCIK